MSIDKHEIKRLHLINRKDGIYGKSVTYVHYCRCNPDTFEYEELPKNYIKLDKTHAEYNWFCDGKEIGIDIEMVKNTMPGVRNVNITKNVCQCVTPQPSKIYLDDIAHDVCNWCFLYIE